MSFIYNETSVNSASPTEFDVNINRTNYTLQIIPNGTPTTGKFTIYGSLNGIDWAALGGVIYATAPTIKIFSGNYEGIKIVPTDFNGSDYDVVMIAQ